MYNATFRERPKRTSEPTQPRSGENKMTKFEEELFNKVQVTNIDLTTEAEYEKSTLINHFKNWHSDEEFQDMKAIGGSFALANKNLIDENKKLVKEITNLKSQLQQQALPVVPEDVDKAIKYLKKHNNSTLSDLDDILTAKGFSWLNDFQFKDRRFGVGGLNNKLFILSHLAVTGYMVEKPQMFYLRNKLTGMYLYKKPLGGYGEDPANYIKDLANDFKFTQKEIDGMDVQSYEKKDEYKGE